MTTELVKDEIYDKCWGNVKSTVRTNIKVPKEVLQTDNGQSWDTWLIDQLRITHVEHTFGLTLIAEKNACIIFLMKCVKEQKMSLTLFLHPNENEKEPQQENVEHEKKQKEEY